MKRLATAIAAIALMGTPAFAQAPPPAPVYNWTGFYVGVNAGASFGSVKTDFNATPVTVTTNIINFPTIVTPGFAGSNTESPSGFMGGGQIGYNYQLSPIWLVGLEADFQGALEKDNNTLTSPISFTSSCGSPTTTCSLAGSTVLGYETKIDWFGTVRLRAGYLWGDGNVFSYVTGGLAYGKVDTEGTSTVSGTITGCLTTSGCPLAFSNTHAIGHSNVNTGWTLGYGTEGKLATPGWTWRVETLYMDLGHINDSDTPPPAGCGEAGQQTCTVTATGGQTTTNTHFTDWILRGGLSYQFH